MLNGNGSPITPCVNGGPFLCESPGRDETVATDIAGNPIPASLGPNGVDASLAEQTTNTNGFGMSVQVTNRNTIFDQGNQLIVGFSFDGAQTIFDANTTVGTLDVPSRNFIGPGILIDLADGSIAPVRAAIGTGYYGLFFTDTFAVTAALSFTISGRFNSAQIGIKDLDTTMLTGTHAFNTTYYAFGTFSPTTSVPIVQVPNASNPRGFNIGAPIAGFGGLRVTF